MSIFNKLFHKSKPNEEATSCQEEKEQQETISPLEETHKTEPQPEEDISSTNAILRSCENAVGCAQSILNLSLDYTDESIPSLQKLIEHYRTAFQATPSSPTKANIVMMLGCYLGETLRRSHLPEAVWDEAAPLPTLVCGEKKFGPIKEVEAVFNGAIHNINSRYNEMMDVATGKTITPPFSRGQWKERTYENSFLNLSFTLPEQWIAATEDKLAQAMPDSYIMWCCGGPDLMHAVLIMAAPVEKLGLPVGSTALNYLARLRAQLGSSKISYAFSQPFLMPIAGQYYSVLPCLREGKDLQLYAARALHNHISVLLFSMPEKDKQLFPILAKQFLPLACENTDR